MTLMDYPEVLIDQNKNGHKSNTGLDDQKTKSRTGIEIAVDSILRNIGEDPSREGLLGTPNRVARMYEELTSGYETDPVKLINGAIFTAEDYDEMIVVRDIDFNSLCEHHMLPFYGRAHVAYIPKGKVIGLSKIPRIVDMFARRLQIQEQMTTQIAHFIQEVLNPKGVAVIVEGAGSVESQRRRGDHRRCAYVHHDAGCQKRERSDEHVQIHGGI